MAASSYGSSLGELVSTLTAAAPPEGANLASIYCTKSEPPALD